MAEPGAAPSDAADLPELRWMFERGYVRSIEGEVKSGKEATVYLGRGPSGLLAVKVFRDLAVRSFKNDARYRAGRFVGDARTEKAMARRSAYGKRAQAALWAAHEYRMLWRFRAAGVRVPEPMIGPDASDIAKAGSVVLMSFVGDEEAPAPRLSDVELAAAAAADALRQAVDALARIWRAGFVHGDYSTYNLLWWQGAAVVIDLPQVVDARHREARTLLVRDVESLCTSFRRHGVAADPGEVLADVERAARGQARG